MNATYFPAPLQPLEVFLVKCGITFTCVREGDDFTMYINGI